MGKNKKFTAVETPVEEPKIVEEIIEETPTVEEQLPEEPVKKPKKEVVEVDAIVDGVKMNLNIRSNPRVEPNNQIAILGKGTKVIVMNPDKEYKSADGETWLKIKLKK